jgi:hypothetical protein
VDAATGQADEFAQERETDIPKLVNILTSFGNDTGAGFPRAPLKLVAQGDNGDVSHLSGAAMNAQASANATEITCSAAPKTAHGTGNEPLLLQHHRRHHQRRGYPDASGYGSSMSSIPNSATPSALVEGSTWAATISPHDRQHDRDRVRPAFMQEDSGNNARLAKVWM